MKLRLKSAPLIAILPILLFLVPCSFQINTNADDWTGWRGLNRDGISMETDWDPNALSGGPRILWKINVGLGYSSVAVKW